MPDFIPAARFRSLTPLYDVLCRAMGLGNALREFEMSVVAREEARDVLEVGCGTGELTVRLALGLPGAAVTGIDVDPSALAIAEQKLRDASARARFLEARAEALPCADASVDLVVSSLVVHHLRSEQKQAAFREWRRVLRPGGAALLFDFGAPATGFGRAAVWPLRFNLFEETGDNFAGRIPEFLARAGLVTDELESFRGVVRSWRAHRGVASPGAYARP